MGKQLFTILIVLFLGFVGFSLVIPLFPPILMDANSPVHLEGWSQTARHITLGFLLSMYPIGQFFGCPLLGKLSDRHGRRKILLISLFGAIPSFMVAAFAIQIGSLPLLFLSRLLSGLFGGNVTIAQAAIADISPMGKSKVLRFGWMVSVSATGFIVGPLIGGLLATHVNFAAPFWASALLNLIALATLAFLFKESRQHKGDEVKMKEVFLSIFHGLRAKHLRHIYSANFLIYIGIFFFLVYFIPYLFARFDFSEAKLSGISAYLSIPICLTPFSFAFLSKRFSTLQLTRFTAFFLAAGMTLFALPSGPNAFYLTLILPGIAVAMVFTYATLLVSDAVPAEQQGHALGTNQAIQVFVEAIVAMAGGFLLTLLQPLPLLVGAVCSVAGGYYLLSPLFKHKR